MLYSALIRMAIKKCVAVRKGVIYDSQATNRKQGGLPVRASLPLPYSYWSSESHIRLPAGRNTQKDHHKQGEAFTFWLKNCLKQHCVDKNL